jgi:hypothetical protein
MGQADNGKVEDEKPVDGVAEKVEQKQIPHKHIIDISKPFQIEGMKKEISAKEMNIRQLSWLCDKIADPEQVRPYVIALVNAQAMKTDSDVKIGPAMSVSDLVSLYGTLGGK